MTDKKKELQDILHDIQTKLRAPKSNTNKFGGYKYRSCEDILEAVKAILPTGVFITINDEVVLIGDRYYVKAVVTLFMSQNNGVSATAFAREPDNKKGFDESQITGAASSYARKYALNGLFAIDDTKDADSQDNRDNEPNKAKSEPNKAKSEPIKKKAAPKKKAPLNEEKEKT